MIGCEIVSASRKGFFVRGVDPSTGMMDVILCAGSLNECLEFVRDEFEKFPKDEQSEAAA